MHYKEFTLNLFIIYYIDLTFFLCVLFIQLFEYVFFKCFFLFLLESRSAGFISYFLKILESPKYKIFCVYVG